MAVFERQKATSAFYAAALAALTLFFFVPLQIYFFNRTEFRILFIPLGLFLAGVTIALSLVLGLVLTALPDKLHGRAVALVSAVAVLCWLQAYLLAWDYGPIEAHRIHWQRYRFRGTVDAAVWIGGIGLAWARGKRYIRCIPRLCAALVILQVISLIWAATRASGVPVAPSIYSQLRKKLPVFSPHKNVMLIILDSSRSDFFSEIFDREPELKAGFEGFTLFRDSLAVYNRTFLEVPLLLSGLFYDNSRPFVQYARSRLFEHSLPQTLNENGFITQVYSYVAHFLYFEPALVSNLTLKKPDLSIAPFLWELAMFRALPQAGKMVLHDGEEWRLHRYFPGRRKNTDIDFLRLPCSLAKKRQPLFKIIHLKGMHPGLFYNEKLEYESMAFDSRGYRRQARGLVSLLLSFLDGLKKTGAYDNSAIVIVGDHGEETKDETGTPGSLGRRSGVVTLVKPFDSQGELRFSDAQVSLADVPATVCDLAGVEGSFQGKPMLSVPETQKRRRVFLDHRWMTRFKNDEFMPVLKEYIIEGPSRDEASWKHTRDYAPPEQKRRFPVRGN